MAEVPPMVRLDIVEKPGKPSPDTVILEPDTALLSAMLIVAPGIVWAPVPAGVPAAVDVAVIVLADGIPASVPELGTVMVAEKTPALSGVTDPTVVLP